MDSAGDIDEKGKSQWAGTTSEQCQTMMDHAIRKNMYVRFMIDKLRESGCDTETRKFFKIENCQAQVGGGYRPDDLEVVLCHNHLSSKSEIETALVHELIHAYDHCRAKDLDWTNCEHHACTEIRAASLSGDCDFIMEAKRGNLSLAGQHQKCVRRRAILSVSMNPYCEKDGCAEKAVDAVFSKCFEDTAPFDRRP